MDQSILTSLHELDFLFIRKSKNKREKKHKRKKKMQTKKIN